MIFTRPIALKVKVAASDLPLNDRYWESSSELQLLMLLLRYTSLLEDAAE